MHPYGQRNLGLPHSVQCDEFDMRRIEHLENGQILIICMFDLQAKELQKLKSFQIDLAFKRVHVMENLSRIAVKFYHIDGTSWECILGNLNAAQAKGLGFDAIYWLKFNSEVYSLATSIPSKLDSDYRQLYVLSSLNNHISNMENEIRERNGNTVMRGRRLDEGLFKVAEVHDKFGVPYTRKDKKKLEKPRVKKIEERKVQSAERQVANSRAQAEVEKLELENMKLRRELEN
ncbi:hypothetical protein GLOIN_2v1545568 [Rhizophagus clarus]|uniref:Uncharacterized protein n=1 Tax=Rhizophagus clarus TaxID=94130 RepID=A0A8H3M9Z9_9GLOM|nr:hypothetical protein GLOIN_2v1545568 [Rhizophagus clarus]